VERILIVEDEKPIREFMTIVLGREDFHVLQAVSGEEALAMLQDHEVDLMVLDIRLPGIDGFEVCRQEDALEDIMHLVMEDIPYQIIDERAAAFRCKCSQEKINSIAAALSQEDIEQACADRGLLEITCNFCNQVYQLTPAEIEEIKKASGEDSQG
jgi:CheY-like chemotaxis protein